MNYGAGGRGFRKGRTDTDVDLTEYWRNLNPRQREAHACRTKYLLFGGAVGGGKSAFLVNDALRRCLAWNNNRVGIYRWEFSSFKSTTYVELDRWVLSQEGLVQRHNQNDHEVELVNGSVICYGGLKPSESAAGDLNKKVKSLAHSDLFLDEVTDFPELAFNFALTRIGRWPCVWAATGERDTPSGIGRFTCNPELSWVKTRFVDRPKPGFAFIRSTVYDNKGNLSDGYIESLKMNNDPDWVARYVTGAWPAAPPPAAIYPPELLYRAVAMKARPSGIVEFGVDVGAEGNDPSVIAKRKGMASEILWRGKEPNTMRLVGRVESLADRHNPRLIKIDSIGVGKGPYDALGEDGYPVMPMVGGAAPRDKSGNFRNQRAEIHWGFRRLLQEGRVSLPDDPQLINQLGSIRYSQTASGRVVQVESKDELKKRLGRSPDDADAVIYSFAYAEPGFGAMTA